ncbi:MAG: nucleotidyltransferase domain-containing protein [Candidatus Eremiobacteraeota bacterium]|nr:nucleotidyltransferase domain-containing protein [Candidatus Eremiobacteraeota bacterium]
MRRHPSSKGSAEIIVFSVTFLYNRDMKQTLPAFISALEEKGILSPVSLIYIFGSVAADKATPMSDIDIAVLFEHLPGGDPAYEEILSEMVLTASEALRLPEERIDIKALNGSPLFFQYQVISKNSVIYARNRREKEFYESSLLSEYLDYNYYEEIHDRALQKRLAEGSFGHRPKIVV